MTFSRWRFKVLVCCSEACHSSQASYLERLAANPVKLAIEKLCLLAAALVILASCTQNTPARTPNQSDLERARIPVNGDLETTDVAKIFADLESAYAFIQTELSKQLIEHLGLPESVQDLKENSQATSISVGDQSFFVVYADFKKSIRGHGGNGPVHVFHKLAQEYHLVYSNAFDELVNNVTIQKDDRGDLVLRTLAHIGLSAGDQQPVEYRWDGTRFVDDTHN
ncbi:MAG: hypothetical protein JWP89_3099 [Schlesneria sp.]|nr:hypothetical protein [Schlesneria sp.]